MSDKVVEEENENEEEEALRQTDIAVWYPRFESDTLRCTFIPLSPEFQAYLAQDGMVIPKSLQSTKPAAEEDYETFPDEGEEFWSSKEGEEGEEEEMTCPEFPELQAQIAEAIVAFGGAVHPRGSHSCGQDAAWILGGGRVKCVSVEDVFMLVKASPTVAHELTDPGHCQALRHPPLLALRKFYSIDRALEFRVFVCRHTLVGLSQRHCTQSHAFLASSPSLQATLKATLTSFWATTIHPKVPCPSYTVDIYLQRKSQGSSEAQYRPFVVSFGVFGGEGESPCLFTWPELRALSSSSSSSRPVSPELRVVPEGPPGRMGPADSSYSALPYDLRGVSGEAVDLDALKALCVVGTGKQQQQQC